MTSRLFLDSHALVWWVLEDYRLPASARRLIERPDRTVLVSSASVWGIGIKHRLGKWDDAGIVLERIDEILELQGFSELPVSIAHARTAGALDGPHRDPFDRLLIAQAILENATILSSDRVFAGFPVLVLWS